MENPIESVIAEEEEPAMSADKAASSLNNWVAITITLIATFMGICKIKDDNIVQAMQQAQADRIDHWGYYQAYNIREATARATLGQLQAATMVELSPSARDTYARAIAAYEATAKDQADKKESVKAQAETDQYAYDALNYRDDQFDSSDAFLALAISLLAVTSLPRNAGCTGSL